VANDIRTRLKQFVWRENSLLEELSKLKDQKRGSEATKALVGEVAASLAGRVGRKVAKSIVEQKQRQLFHAEEMRTEGRHNSVVQEIRDFLSTISMKRKRLKEPNSGELVAKIARAQDFVRIGTRIRRTIRAIESMLNRELIYNEEIPVQPGETVILPRKPFTGSVKLKEILRSLRGYAKILDPYVDERTLELLIAIPEGLPIKVLATYTGGRTTERRFVRTCKAFKAERPRFEIRKSREIHDRFILGEKKGWNIGSSLKDLGKRMSMINALSPGIKKKAEEVFDKMWSRATSIAS